MDYCRPPRAERLAGEYVMGTLSGPARRRFEALLPAHPALREAVAGWQQRLMPLTSSVAPAAPSSRVWQGIERSLFGTPAPAPRWWQRLGLWQGWASLASVACVALAVVSLQPVEVQPPVVVVLSPHDSNVRFVASVSADGRSLVLRPVDGVTLAANRVLELWAMPPQGAPRSLGLVSASGRTTVLRPQLLQGTAAFAVSVEPPGGSPTGVPTGPVVSMGKIDS